MGASVVKKIVVGATVDGGMILMVFVTGAKMVEETVI